MKITAFLILTTIMQVSATSYAQNINLSEKSVSLKTLFKKIKIQTGYDFVYSESDLKDAKTVSITVIAGKIDEVLQKILSEQLLTYTISNNTVVIKEKPLTISDKGRLAAIIIHGIVMDNNGNPLVGVTVFNHRTKQGTITDNKGNYNLPAQKGDILEFSFIGFKTKEILTGEQQLENISLEITAANLDQVVVVGYGTTQRKDLTGSVGTVAAAQIENVPFTTVDNALAGKVAGVEVTKADGTPGGAVKIRIRGSTSLLGGNDPLYVIDGVPLQVQSNFINPGFGLGNPIGQDVSANAAGSTGLSTPYVDGLNSLGGLNPDDIESITILKDASATAIYGSKAANGVVIITTKKGKKDMKPVITASYYTTVTSPITPHLLNADQYRSLLTEAANNTNAAYAAGGQGSLDLANSILDSASTFFGKANTNWIKEVTRNTVSENAELSLQGGGNSSKYFSSISYNNTPGVVDATDYQRVSGKINLENDIGSKFRVITNIIMGYTNQDIGDGAYSQALRARPDYSPYDASGNYNNFSQLNYYYVGYQNPLALLTATNNAKTFSLLGSLSGIYDITKNLQFKSTGSLNLTNYNQRNFLPSYVEIYDNYGTDNDGIGGNSNSNITNWFLENTLTYSKTFNTKHQIDVVAGTSFETDKTTYFSAAASGYPNDNVLTSLSSATTPLVVTGDEPQTPQSYLLSFYLRANYGYMDKYLFTFTGRSDASSKFGPDNKVGYFPSGAIAWRISKEDFLKDIKWIDDIKLRGSYGLTGTQNIGNQMYRTLYTPVYYGDNNALVPTQLGNAGIKWESTREADGGIDISLFNGRLQATVDYYNKQTSDALLSLPVAPSTSYSTLLSNSVGIKNTGVEVSFQGDIIRSKDFKWDASINITWNNSLVTKLPPSADLGQIGNLTGLEIGNTTLIQGQPLGLIVGEDITGILKTQAQVDAYKKQLGSYARFYPTLGIGDPIIALDYSNEALYGGATPSFNQVIAHAAPKYYGGFTQGFTYKKFDIQFYFTFSEGGKLLWADHVGSDQFEGTANANVSILNRYTPENTNTDQPRLILENNYESQSNLDIFNSSYLKLRTLTVNYRFDKMAWMQAAGMQSASLFISATNLFTITKYPGNDPETTDDPYSAIGGYLDVSNYPSVRTFSIGLKVGF
jgi:TonB-linked SusC/RagA family outer membrane protein